MWYFDSFGVEYILKEIQKFIGNKIITTNIYIIQAYDSIICLDTFLLNLPYFMFKGNSLTNSANLFSSSNFKNSDKLILNHFLNWN